MFLAANNFKQTETCGERSRTIGLIPEDWKVVRLGDIFHMQQGKAMSPKSRLGISPRPFLRTVNVLWGRLNLTTLDYMDFTDEEITKLCLQPGDLLVCEGGEVGRTAIWWGEIKVCGYQNHIHRLRKQRQDVWSEFYAYWMQAAFLIFDLYAGQEIKTTIPNLSGGRLKSFLVPLPPLPEQRKIAKVLSTIQRAIEQQDKIIEATKKLKKSLMQKFFRFGISDLGVADLKDTKIGLLPKNWEVARLEEMFDMQQGKAMSPKSRLGISPHPFLRTVNILWGNVDLSILDYMDFTDEEMTKLCLQPDDLLVFEGGEIGRTAMWRGEIEVCGYQNHIHRLRKRRQDINPEFYMYWMQAAFLIFGLYAGEEIRTTIPNLSRGRLKSFLIPKPPFSEQQEIARILSTVDKKIATEERREATLKELFKTMLHKLMSGEIRVKDVEFADLGFANSREKHE